MSILTENIRFGRHSGYLAWPERAVLPLPAVLVLQEAWGLDAHIEDVTRRFAAAGYAAFAPDLYADDGVRPAPLVRERMTEMLAFLNAQASNLFADKAARAAALASLPQPQRLRLAESFDAISANLGKPRFLDQTLAAARWLRETSPTSCGQPLASVGFCMGGANSALLACEYPELSAAVVFYGAPPPAEKVAGIRCSLLGLYGALDARINASLPAFTSTMKKLGKSFEAKVYDGAQHAFFNDGRPSYNAAASRDAFARTLAFLLGSLV